MLLNRVLLVPLVLLLPGMAARAATFTVTTNADSGPGSLRDAITQAAVNGSASTDNIVFNIADQSAGGRTIMLLSELPALSSNLVIDGTTQRGAAFGISSAKIELCLSGPPATGYFTCLLVRNASNVQIYGLYLFYAQDPREIGDLYGIRVQGSTNVVIGAAGKGNVIEGWFLNITNSYWTYDNDTSSAISIKGNLLGVGVNGTPPMWNALFNPSMFDISLTSTHDIDIGGLALGEGNQMYAIGGDISLSYNDMGVPGSYFAHLRSNLLNVDPSGTIPYFSGNETAIYLNGPTIIPADTAAVKTELTKNVISGSGGQMQVYLTNLNHLVKIMGNRIGTDITGTKQIGGAIVGLAISGCYKVLVGGDHAGDTNYFAGNITGLSYGSPHCLISKNSFFCNNTGIELAGWTGRGAKPFITINTYSPAVIGGTANPLARIELFQNSSCGLGFCEGRYYVSTVYADNEGNWSYSGPQPAPMIATATTVDSATSAFPVPALDASGAVVNNATCGKNNGSITGVRILSGNTFKWVNITDGSTVGTDTNLVNMGPGSYSLVVSLGTNGCVAQTQFYDIVNISPPSTIQTYLLNPTCGQRNGQIFVYSDLSGLVGKWVDSLGDTLSFAAGEPYFPPGVFRYVVYTPEDTGCAQVYGPYTLVSPNGASIDVSGVSVSAATCNRANGGISGIQFTNVTGTPVYEWVDSAGQAVGRALNLANVPPGRYMLKFKDQGPCDTIVVGPYQIPQIPIPRIAGGVVGPDICSKNTGSVTGLVVTGASPFTYSWYSTDGGEKGDGLELTGMSAGSYFVVVTDTNSCNTTSRVFVIGDSSLVITPPQYQDQIVLTGGNVTLKPLNADSGRYLLFLNAGMGDTAQQNTTGIFSVGPVAGDMTVYVMLTDEGCASAPDPVQIKAVPTLSLVMPNAFTPNGDGRNDLFKVKYPEAIKTFQMRIYNRWGQEVFGTSNPYSGWDGRVGNQLQPPGVYVWEIQYTDVVADKVYSMKGTVILLR